MAQPAAPHSAPSVLSPVEWALGRAWPRAPTQAVTRRCVGNCRTTGGTHSSLLRCSSEGPRVAKLAQTSLPVLSCFSWHPPLSAEMGDPLSTARARCWPVPYPLTFAETLRAVSTVPVGLAQGVGAGGLGGLGEMLASVSLSWPLPGGWGGVWLVYEGLWVQCVSTLPGSHGHLGSIVGGVAVFVLCPTYPCVSRRLFFLSSLFLCNLGLRGVAKITQGIPVYLIIFYVV